MEVDSRDIRSLYLETEVLGSSAQCTTSNTVILGWEIGGKQESQELGTLNVFCQLCKPGSPPTTLQL